MSAGILVGTDFSDGAALALAEARRLAGSMALPLHLAHVGDAPAAEGWPEDARHWMERHQVDAGSLAVRPGIPAVELARMAKELDAGWVFLGTHGASGYQPLALGATASRMALLAPCPVVLVGPRGRGRGPSPARRNQASNRAFGGRTSEPAGPAAPRERS